jgi:uncharacterized protein YciI
VASAAGKSCHSNLGAARAAAALACESGNIVETIFVSIRGGTVHYLLMYELAPDYMERRGQYRDEHLKLAWDAQARGEIVLAGALAEPADCAVLLFSAESPEPAERFAAADPYVTNGLVTSYRVRPWTTVVGDDAFNPVRPG